MNTHSRTHMDQHDTQGESRKTQVRERPARPGLWKLLVAAALILLGLLIVVGLFEDTESEFNTPNPAQQTDNE